MKKQRLLSILITFLILSAAASAQQLSSTPFVAPTRPPREMKSFQLDSKLMARPMPYGVIFPDSYDADRNARFPVIYWLHGLGEGYKRAMLSPAGYQDKQRVILVFVEGGISMYTDSATKPNDKYESYLVNELIPEVDKNLRTIAERRARAVAGGSMGGYGSLKFGIKYPQLFSLAVSWSGAVNTTKFHDPKEWPAMDPAVMKQLKDNVVSIFGDGKDRAVLDANDLTKLFSEYPAEKISDLPFFFLDCGMEDQWGFFKPNRELSEIMINRKIPHEYREFPGGHAPDRPDQFPHLYRLAATTFAKQTEEQFVRVLKQQGLEQAVKLYKENIGRDAQQPVFNESFFNDLGYTLIKEKRMPLAIEVFKLNVQANPSSWNTYDSLGEAYLLSGNKDMAIKFYEKSVELNPKNQFAIEALKKLKSNP